MRSNRTRRAATFLGALVLIAGATRVVAATAEPPAAPSEDAAWQALEARYQAAVRDAEGAVASEQKTLAERAEQLRGTLATQGTELARLRATIAERERLVSRLSTRRRFGISGSIAFCLLLVHLLAYLFRAPQPPFPFRPMLYVALAIIVLFALPAFAAENLDQALSDGSRLATASPAEKGLYWLAHLDGHGTLPSDIPVTDPLLTPYRELQRGSAEWHFTRAALLWEMRQHDDALTALREVVTAAPQTNPSTLYARTIRVLLREDAPGLVEVASTALPRISDPSALTAVALELAKAGKDVLAKKAAEALGTGTASAADLLASIRAFYQGDHRELAAPLAGAAVAKARDVGELASLVSIALEYADRRLAITAIEQAIGRFGTAVADLGIDDPAVLYPKDELAGEEEISLAVLLGILNQREGLTAGAKPAYEHAAASELERVLGTAAFAFPARLRVLFYVERFWRQQGEETRLRLLRPVYERVQDATLASLRERRQAEQRAAVEKLSGEIAALEAQLAGVERDVTATRAALRRLNILLPLRIARLIAIVGALVLIVVGCARWAQRRGIALAAPHGAVGWGFTEACGWVLVFSVIGVWVGLPLVLVSRFVLRGPPASAAGTA